MLYGRNSLGIEESTQPNCCNENCKDCLVWGIEHYSHYQHLNPMNESRQLRQNNFSLFVLYWRAHAPYKTDVILAMNSLDAKDIKYICWYHQTKILKDCSKHWIISTWLLSYLSTIYLLSYASMHITNSHNQVKTVTNVLTEKNQSKNLYTVNLFLI